MAVARLPLWARKPFAENNATREVDRLLETLGLNTVCRSARCPNRWECYSLPSLTFIILGTVCTRKCGFCGVSKGEPGSVDAREPFRLAQAARKLRLDFVVLTSVTRDDLSDGGASHFARCVEELRGIETGPGVEVLVPDFGGESRFCLLVLEARPDVFSHNVETIPRLYPTVRPGADYSVSLKLIETAALRASGSVVVKSGFMVGLGEKEEEVMDVLRDLRNAGCRSVTIGQYLRPTLRSLPVREYVSPERFRHYEETGKRLGFDAVYAGPLVRSSYKAFEIWRNVNGDHDSK
ncbi:MAG: lipoyl synthase [Candidatus Eisenbacteria bacterium]|nr:lipoyl synthase [Candidatus Eisenbacteria bacterium]